MLLQSSMENELGLYSIAHRAALLPNQIKYCFRSSVIKSEKKILAFRNKNIPD